MQFADDLRKELSLIQAELDKEIAKIYRNKEIGFQVVALRGLCNYTVVLFERLIANQNAPIEFIAILARNLFECYLLISYIIEEPSSAKEFIGQKAYDELAINEGFLALKTPASEGSIKIVQERMDYIQALMESAELAPSKHWTVGYLAQKTNNKIEYDAFFKLFSKYVHPSSWLVNGRDDEYDNPVFRNIFFSQGQICTKRIVKLMYKYQGK